MKYNQYDKIFEKNAMFVEKLYLPAKKEMESVLIVAGITTILEKLTRIR